MVAITVRLKPDTSQNALARIMHKEQTRHDIVNHTDELIERSVCDCRGEGPGGLEGQ